MDLTYSINNRVLNATIGGEFIFPDHENFRSILDLSRRQDVDTVVLNVSKVTFIDSAALGMLLLLREENSGKGGQVVLRGARGQVEKMFRLSRFDTMFAMESE